MTPTSPLTTGPSPAGGGWRGLLRDRFFLLAYTALVLVGAYALWHPSAETLDVLKEVALAILVGKFALATPTNGKGI